MRLLTRLWTPMVLGLLVLLPVALYKALIASPPDYQHGEVVRLMYVHVPSAYMALSIYIIMTCAALAWLIWGHVMAHALARCSAPIGAVFTFLCLATGSLWGKPMWGTWWVWDARLTTVFVLFLTYLGYIALAGAIAEEARVRTPLAILTLAGAINLPLIKFSVDWWNTLHQPASILRADGIAIAPELLTPLLLMLVCFGLLYMIVITLRLKAYRDHNRGMALMLRRPHSLARRGP